MTRPGPLDRLAGVVDDIREKPDAPAGTRLTPSGLAVVGVGLLQNLEANLVQLTWLAVGLVFAFLVIRLRSLTRGLLSMAPVLVASGAATLAIWALGISLSPMTAMMEPTTTGGKRVFLTRSLPQILITREKTILPIPAQARPKKMEGHGNPSALAPRMAGRYANEEPRKMGTEPLALR